MVNELISQMIVIACMVLVWQTTDDQLNLPNLTDIHHIATLLP